MQDLKVNVSKDRVFLVTADDEQLVAEVFEAEGVPAKERAHALLEAFEDQQLLRQWRA